MKFEYLLFNVMIASLSTLGAFSYKKSVWPHKQAALYAFLAVCIPYLIWDHFVTNIWWSFNNAFTLGIKIGTLPLEEVLFFCVVPWSCLVIWENLKSKIQGEYKLPIEIFLIGISLTVGIFATINSLYYTGMVSGVVFLITYLSMYSDHWLRKKNSLLFLAIVSILTLIFNGYLTARPIVIYNEAFMTGLRITTIPIEDFMYGLALLSGVVMVYERVLKKDHLLDQHT